MFSNLANYFFGGAPEGNEENPQGPGVAQDEPLIVSSSGIPSSTPSKPEEPLPAPSRPRDPECDSDDWVLVGGSSGRAPTLGSLNEMTPRPVTGSTGSSAPPSENGDGEDSEMVEVGNPQDGEAPADAGNRSRLLFTHFVSDQGLILAHLFQ